MAINDPTTIAMDDLEQCNVDLTQLGVIAFSKHTVQRKRCSFKVYVNAYWNSLAGRITTTTTRNECYADQQTYANLCVQKIITIRYPVYNREVLHLSSALL